MVRDRIFIPWSFLSRTSSWKFGVFHMNNSRKHKPLLLKRVLKWIELDRNGLDGPKWIEVDWMNQKESDWSKLTEIDQMDQNATLIWLNKNVTIINVSLYNFYFYMHMDDFEDKIHITLAHHGTWELRCRLDWAESYVYVLFFFFFFTSRVFL